ALFEEGRDTFFLPDAGGHAPAYLRPFLDGPVRAALLAALRTPAGPLGLLVVDNLPSARPLGPEAALALQRAQLAETLAARAREAEALAQLAETLATPDPRPLYPRLLAAAAPLFPADVLLIVTYREGWAIMEACTGEPAGASGTPLFPLEGAARHWLATLSTAPAALRDTAAEPAWQDIRPWVDDHRLRSVVA